ncbi:MAG: hypothetical protein NTV38_05825 [Chloroflexi bacterium]|nr:hypothetical protein [Chloroflexota bacterium]
MEILHTGTERARLITRQTIEEVQVCMGLLQRRSSAEYSAVVPVPGAFC